MSLPSSFELKPFDARLDAERGLTGRLPYASLMSSDYSAYSAGAAGPIVSASRRPLDTTSFSGTWRGYCARTSCAPVDVCAFAEQNDPTIELEDTGGSLRGTATRWPYRFEVAGPASGSSARLRGQHLWGRDVTADVLVRLQRSETGRLTGAVELTTGTGQSRGFTLLSLVPNSAPEQQPISHTIRPHPWRSVSATGSGTTRSPRHLARAAWARYSVPATAS